MNLKSFKKKIAWKGLKSFEFRVFYWMWRGALVMAFLGYLGANAPGAWKWAQIKWVRTQDLSQMETVMQRATASGDFSWAEDWVSWRPFSESAAILKEVTPYTPKMSPLIFFTLARRARHVGDGEQQKLWLMVARYRLRYDALRCNLADSIEITQKYMKVFTGADPALAVQMTPAENLKFARKALDFDAKYPATDDPEKLCKLMSKMERSQYVPMPKERWEGVRFGLRYVTDLSLTRAEKELKKQEKGGK